MARTFETRSLTTRIPRHARDHAARAWIYINAPC